MSATAPEQLSQIINDAALPDGWAAVKLPDLCELNPLKPRIDALPAEAPVTFVPMPAVDAELGAITTPAIRPFSEVRKGFTAFREGDVIFAKITPCMENGKSAIARHLKNGLGFGSTEFHVLRPTGAVLAEFIYYFIRQEAYRSAAESEMTGSVGQKRVPIDFLKKTDLLLPPLAEQKRIVAKIEELLSRVNASREHLSNTVLVLKRFRQRVLAAACSGRLTENWRAENPETHSASKMLGQIDADRARVVGRRKTSEAVLIDAANEPDDLPEKWIWTRGGRLFAWSSGKFLPKSRQQKGRVPVYGGNGITGYHDEALTNQPTLVIGRVGALCGNVYVTKGKAWVTDNAIYASFVPTGVELPYIEFVLTQTNLNKNAGGSGQPFVDQGVLNETTIPLPPFEEQREIVRRVEALFKLADIIEKRVGTATKRAEKVTQAVLAKAFRGELVPTEAELAHREGREYEPASVLLERIRAERNGKEVAVSKNATRGIKGNKPAEAV